MNGETRTATAASTSRAFSFISKGWREVRDSADADLQLMRARANSFKNLAATFDREIENLIQSAPTFAVPAIGSSSEIEFMKKLQPKISEFRRVYSAPEISKKVMEKWAPRARLGIDLSGIRNAIVSEVEDRDVDGIIEYDRLWRGRRLRVREEGQVGEWELIRKLKTRLREFEKKSSIPSTEIFSGFKNSEILEKVKSSLVSLPSF